MNCRRNWTYLYLYWTYLYLWLVIDFVLSLFFLSSKYVVHYALCLYGSLSIWNRHYPILDLRFGLILCELVELLSNHVRFMPALRSQILAKVGLPGLLEFLLLMFYCPTLINFPTVYSFSVFFRRTADWVEFCFAGVFAKISSCLLARFSSPILLTLRLCLYLLFLEFSIDFL